MNSGDRTLVWIAVILIVPVAAFYISAFLPNTFGDMKARLDAMEVPSDFVVVDEYHGGQRSGFAGASDPSFDRHYVVPWRGDTCERTRRILASKNPIRDLEGGECRYLTQIDAGWRGRIVGVSEYRLEVTVIVNKGESKPSSNQTIRPLDQLERPPDALPEYWIPPGYAKVRFKLTGAQGW